MKRVTAGLVVAVISLGCTPGLLPITPAPLVLKNYEIGETKTAGIGDPIFDIQASRELPTYVAGREFTAPRIYLTGSPHRIAAGTRFEVTATLPDGKSLVLSDSTIPFSIVIDSAGKPYSWVDSFGRLATGGDWPTEPIFERSTGVRPGTSAFRAQLIYSGLDNRSLRAVYREFAENLIRPAFTQELQYDLSASREIGYKSLRIEVLEASNSQVRYRVVADGGLEWLPR